MTADLLAIATVCGLLDSSRCSCVEGTDGVSRAFGQQVLSPGRSVTVEVPATSANLGPGFDCFGLALDWRERVNLR